MGNTDADRVKLREIRRQGKPVDPTPIYLPSRWSDGSLAGRWSRTLPRRLGGRATPSPVGRWSEALADADV